MDNTKVTSVNTNLMPWEMLPVEEIDAEIPLKTCIQDEDTGMAVWKLCYKAGFTNPHHKHDCAHGMYVLDGILRTSAGDFGPGEFVWFPAGTEMFHGATPENDVTCLFITNKAFNIEYMA